MNALAGNHGWRTELLILSLSVGVPMVQGGTLWFEDFSGFVDGPDRLALEGEWDADTIGYQAHGIVEGVLPEGGRSGYIGLGSPPDDVVGLWHPVRLPVDRLVDGIIEFSAVVAVVDSSNRRWDNFFVTFGNDAGDSMAAINFDNSNLLVFVDDGIQVTNTEVSFVPDSYYELSARIDLIANQWSVFLDDEVLIESQTFHAGPHGAEFGRIGFEWWVTNLNRPGDNFLVFDDLRLEAPAGLVEEAPPILDLSPMESGALRLSWEGSPSTSYSVERSHDLKEWVVLDRGGVMVPEGGKGTYVYLDEAAGGTTSVYYRVRSLWP